MWQQICIVAEGLLHLICLIGLVAAICVVGTWGLSAYVMYHWMQQQSGQGIKFVNNKNKENDIYNKQGNQQTETVVKKMGVM